MLPKAKGRRSSAVSYPVVDVVTWYMSKLGCDPGRPLGREWISSVVCEKPHGLVTLGNTSKHHIKIAMLFRYSYSLWILMLLHIYNLQGFGSPAQERDSCTAGCHIWVVLVIGISRKPDITRDSGINPIKSSHQGADPQDT